MNNTEYKKLIWELGSSWQFRNDLRFEAQDKVGEIIKLQTKYTNGKISRKKYLIKSFILNKEKDLLIKLFRKEDARVWKQLKK